MDSWWYKLVLVPRLRSMQTENKDEEERDLQDQGVRVKHEEETKDLLTDSQTHMQHTCFPPITPPTRRKSRIPLYSAVSHPTS